MATCIIQLLSVSLVHQGATLDLQENATKSNDMSLWGSIKYPPTANGKRMWRGPSTWLDQKHLGIRQWGGKGGEIRGIQDTLKLDYTPVRCGMFIFFTSVILIPLLPTFKAVVSNWCFWVAYGTFTPALLSSFWRQLNTIGKFHGPIYLWIKCCKHNLKYHSALIFFWN